MLTRKGAAVISPTPESIPAAPAIQILQETKRVTTNPFAEMEKKKAQEKLRRMKSYASVKFAPAELAKIAADYDPDHASPLSPTAPMVSPSRRALPTSPTSPAPQKQEEYDAVAALLAAVGDMEMPSEAQLLEQAPTTTTERGAPVTTEEDIADMEMEADLLLEASDMLEAQRITIQEQMTLISEQEILLIKQKETIGELQHALAALQTKGKSAR